LLLTASTGARNACDRRDAFGEIMRQRRFAEPPDRTGRQRMKDVRLSINAFSNSSALTQRLCRFGLQYSSLS
jgi:hypothetical protein